MFSFLIGIGPEFSGYVYGPQFVKGVKGPQPWTSIMPTGGVSPARENLKGWFDSGVTCVGMGSKEILESKDFKLLKSNVMIALSIIKEIKDVQS